MAAEEESGVSLREARNTDADAVIQLIARCFADYPGCILDCDAEEPELRTPGSSFPHFWVAEERSPDRPRAVVGCIGCRAGTDIDGVTGVELKKLYVHPDARRRGIGRTLVDRVEAFARGVPGARRIFLWSDARFLAAHRTYERLGYLRGPQLRELHDLSSTVEFRFAKELTPVSAVAGRAARSLTTPRD